MKNAIVVDGGTVLNPEGLRRKDEFVRHKMLDALGDLSLAGGPIFAEFSAYKGGHRMTNLLLRALFADPEAYEFIDVPAEMEAFLPGRNLSDLDLQAVS